MNTRICLLAIAALTLSFRGALSQESRSMPSMEFPDLLSRAKQLDIQASPQAKGMPLESTIDPEHYYVGPSDVIAVNLWVSPQVSLSLTVTPEGTLIVPSVGELKVADLTLAEARKQVVAEVRKKYISGDITVTLVTPRPVSVMVTGTVLTPGSYALAAYNRVDKAIEEANRLLRVEDTTRLTLLAREMSKRNIGLRRKDGSFVRVDLMMFYATKEDRYNPYLREGDVIVVPRSDYTRNVVGIYGEVNLPGRFECVDGDRASDLIRMAFGFGPRAVTDSVELTRLSADASAMSSVYLDGKAILAGNGEDPVLRSGDRIVVRSRVDERGDYRVVVTGEVVHPGTYPITKRSTRLSELMSMAGGFLPDAALGIAQVFRQATSPQDYRREFLMSGRGNLLEQDEKYYDDEARIRLWREVVRVDFERLFQRGDSSADVILMDGDSIGVPTGPGTVYVFGQVVSPGNIRFVSGEDVGYYVAKAGGYAENARTGDVKIIKAKTRLGLSPDDTPVEMGDKIWVPAKPDRPFSYYLNIVGQVASIVSVALSIIILSVQVTK